MKKCFILGTVFVVLFIVFTLLVSKVDVQPIGRQGSDVGFASLNQDVNELFGQHTTMYDITEKLGYLAFAIIACFGILGIYQLISRRSLLKVDRDIIVLGGFYVVVLALYVAFNKIVINYRPVFQGEQELEASYPSSHTMMMVCVVATAVIQILRRIKNKNLKFILCALCILLGLAVIIGRMICGVHWFTDIIGSIIISTGLVELYCGLAFHGGKKK